MKQKTHKGTAKRTKITGTGKVMFNKACRNHLLSSKNKRQLKSSTGGIIAPKGHMLGLSRLLKISKKSGRKSA